MAVRKVCTLRSEYTPNIEVWKWDNGDVSLRAAYGEGRVYLASDQLAELAALVQSSDWQ